MRYVGIELEDAIGDIGRVANELGCASSVQLAFSRLRTYCPS